MNNCCNNNCKGICNNSNICLPKRSCCNPCSCCCKCKPGLTRPFLSSYIEATGSTQVVASRSNFVFNVNEGDIDVAGNDIEVDATGSVFTIRRAGLYHVEWSINLESGTQPIVVCLMENGEPSSAMSNIALSGNYSSGALINVTEDEVPFTVSLYNFGGEIAIADQTDFSGTAASMRILRFADGPTV